MIPGFYFGLIPLCYHCNGGNFVMRKRGVYSRFLRSIIIIVTLSYEKEDPHRLDG